MPTSVAAVRDLPETLVAMSGVFGGSILVEAGLGVTLWSLGSGFLISVVTTLPFVVGIGYGGRWLSTSGLDPNRYRRIAGWCLGGSSVFLAMNALVMFVVPPRNLLETAIWFRWACSIGAGTGLLVGIFDALAIDRGDRFERARLRAEAAESRQELLDYLNALLRHEVLNSANVIDGPSGLLLERETIDPSDRPALKTIQRRARDLSTVIDDVRVLLQTTTDDTPEKTLDVVSVLEAELDTLTDYERSVTVETDFPDSAPVRADDLLPRAFSNLFANAVEHHDDPSPTVSVTVTTTAESVRIVVADDGPGVPPAKRRSLFQCGDPGSDHGLGLSLVATLLERYGGSIELTDSGPDGSVFTVELPLASTAHFSGAGATEECGTEASTTPARRPGVATE